MRIPAKIAEAYKLMKKNPSFKPFVRRSIGADWLWHFDRFGNVVDAQLIDEIAKVLGWSEPEKKDVARWSKERELVKSWSDRFRRTDEYPPVQMLEGYMLSSLMRGRYYQNVSLGTTGQYIWHPFRNYVLDPIVDPAGFERSNERLVGTYLAGIICRAAMEEDSEEEVVGSWASNILKVTGRALEIPEESDPQKACGVARDLAREWNLDIRWEQGERILEGAFDHFLVPLFGIAIGLLAGTAHPSMAISAHLGAEHGARPFADSLKAKISDSVVSSDWYLGRLAKSGAERIFAVTKGDLGIDE
jgi:hypothetical protein